MSSNIYTVQLNLSNFGYYAFRCRSEELSATDKTIATLATILLGLTLGIGHLICRVFYKRRVTEIKQLEILKTKASLETASEDDHYLLGIAYEKLGYFGNAGSAYAQSARMGSNLSLNRLQTSGEKYPFDVNLDSIKEEWKTIQLQHLKNLQEEANKEDSTATDHFLLGAAYERLELTTEAANSYEQAVRKGLQACLWRLENLVNEYRLDIDLDGLKKELHIKSAS